MVTAMSFNVCHASASCALRAIPESQQACKALTMVREVESLAQGFTVGEGWSSEKATPDVDVEEGASCHVEPWALSGGSGVIMLCLPMCG